MSELFISARKILEAIGFDEDSIHQQTIFPGGIKEATLTTYLDSFMLLIMAHYNKKQIDLRDKTRFTNDIIHVAIEGLLNAKYQGSKQNQTFSHVVLIGDNGVCQGFHDNGDFYKREDIKQKLENKIPLKEITAEEFEKTSGRGILYIYPK